jgi:hypothetical protein
MLEGKLEKQELKTQIMALSIQKAHLKVSIFGELLVWGSQYK